MYARKYYLIIYRRNLLPEYTRDYHQPIVFLRKVTFDLLTFFAFHIHTQKIDRFTPFTIHQIHHSPRSPHSPGSSFISFNIHLFTFTFSPFPLLSPPSPIPLYLTTSGTKTEKIRDNSFFSRKNVLTLQP